MSLVNDVLRQLDDRQAEPAHTIPLQSLQVQPSDQNRFSLQKVLFSIGLLLAITLMLQLFYQQPIKQLLFTQDTSIQNAATQDTAAKNRVIIKPTVAVAALEVPDVVSSNIVTAEKAIPKPAISIPDVVNEFEQKTIPESEIQEAPLSEAYSIESREPISSKVAVNVKENKLEKPKEFETTINKIEIVGDQHYRMAIKAYKKKQSMIAMKWINQAIEERSDEKYSILKARILIQQKLGDELNQYVLSQTDNTSLDWFRLIAPGLQMFGFYQLSNQYYLPLVAQQPNQGKWQLAMALNYSRLGLEEKSYAIYKALARSTVLSSQQKQWVLAKLNRMDSNKVVVNGS